MQGELEENEKSMAELTEQLKKLEEEAGEIMKACQEAEVGSQKMLRYFIPLYPKVLVSCSKKTFLTN